MGNKPQHSFRAPTSKSVMSFVETGAGEGAVPMPAPAATAPEKDEGPRNPATENGAALRAVPTPPQPSTSGRKTVCRADGRELRKQTVYLEAALSRRLAVHCAEQGLDMSQAVAAALEQHLPK